MAIYPRCKSDWAQVFVNSEGCVFPCAWLANHPVIEDYKKLHGEDLKDLTIGKRSLSEIIKDPRFLKVEESWAQEKHFPTCASFCSEPFAQHAMEGTNEVITINLQENP